MKNVKLFKAALATGNSLFILIVIIIGIYNGIDSDKFPVNLAISALLSIPLVLLIIYGLRACQNINDAGSYFALLAISFLLVLVQFLIIYGFLLDPKLILHELLFVGFSIIMFLLWVLNVIAYLNRGKWMNK